MASTHNTSWDVMYACHVMGDVCMQCNPHMCPHSGTCNMDQETYKHGSRYVHHISRYKQHGVAPKVHRVMRVEWVIGCIPLDGCKVENMLGHMETIRL